MKTIFKINQTSEMNWGVQPPPAVARRAPAPNQGPMRFAILWRSFARLGEPRGRDSLRPGRARSPFSTSDIGSTFSRGLALTVLALSLTGSSSFAQITATPTKPTASAASTVAPANNMTAPALAKISPATPSSVMSEDIRDIRGPKHIPSPWLWPLWLAGGAALAALLYAAWRWNRLRALATALLPYEIALAKLEEARALMQPENAREFSITVSEIVRQYIEVRFEVWAARRTTEEFLHDLIDPSDVSLAHHRDLLADFLRHCDLAKFARWILSVEEMETMLQSAHNFVLETGKAPKPEIHIAAAPLVPETAASAPEPVHANS
jgi:hypothetical protein